MSRPAMGLLLVLAGCPGTPEGVPAGQAFELMAGTQVALAGHDLRLTFLDVPSDSRCPVDVTCVWAGNAIVRLHAEGAGIDTVVVVNTTLQPRSAPAGGVRIELLDLLPPAHTATPISPAGYRARLRWSAP